MKKFIKLITTAILSLSIFASCGLLTGCGDDAKTIKVCASQIPHAQVLNECVKDLLAKDGWKLEVKVLDWTLQNEAVASGDYDANYFQHVPYLNTYTGKTELFASCKVHYEPLGIYYGKATVGTSVTLGTSFAICDDESNAVRALNLLEAKGVISKTVEGDNYPVKTNENGEEKLNFPKGKTEWENKAKTLKISLISEELLVTSLADYDFACLPCNTAYTGRIDSSKRAAVEDDITAVSGKANIIAARKADYVSDATYKTKIDALTNAMLSKEVADYFAQKYLGAMTCDSTTQIDLR